MNISQILSNIPICILIHTTSCFILFFCQTLTAGDLDIVRVSSYDKEQQKITDQTQLWAGKPQIILPSEQNFLELEFSPPSPQVGDIEYAYKLGDTQSPWINLGKTNTITFPSLPSGEHLLWLKAETNGQTHIITKSIEVGGAFMGNWLFWALVPILSLLGLSTAALIHKRRQYFRKKQELRIKIASDLHDEVGSTLTRISLGVDLLAADVLPPSERERTLEEVSQMGRNVTSIISDVIWFEDNGKSKLKFLVDKMREEAGYQLQPAGIRHTFLVQHPNYEEELSNTHRRSIYLIFKEAIHNVVKHSGATHVDIHFKKMMGGYQLTIHDNGSLSPKGGKTGQGLSNMRLRAGRIKGSLNISWENGCCIQLHVPLLHSLSKSRGMLMK